MPRAPRAVALGVALVVLVVLGAGCHPSVTVTSGSRAPVISAPSSAASSASDASSTSGGAPGPASGSGTVATAGGNNNLATLDGQARSVETTASVGGLGSAHLAGSSVLTATGDVTDHSGRDLGTGTLRAEGTDVAVSGATLQLATRWRAQPSGVTVNTGGQGSLTLSFPSSAMVTAAHLTFQPPPPPASPSPTAAPAPGSPTTPAVTTTVPPAVPVTGPVTIRSTSVQVSGADLRLVDAPADLVASSSEADLSWAGSGSITTAQGPLQATYLGVRAQQLHVMLHRTAAEVDVHGTGLALQAFVNGAPQLRTAARIDILSTGATTGFLGKHKAFVWTPRNLGNTYDMAITSIHPVNAAASGVYLGLAPMPPMFGGEPQPWSGETRRG